MLRVCTKCQEEKEEKHFKWKNRAKRKRQSICPSCQSVASKKHYQNNKNKYLKRARENNRRYYFNNHKKLFEYLKDKCCTDCGETDSVVLEFDHVKEKTSNVCDLMNQRVSWEKVLKEISKCEIRCANCHRRITFKRGNFIKYQLSTYSLKDKA